MTETTFFVPGIPAPKGSTKSFPFRRKSGRLGVGVENSSKRTKPWQADVKFQARQAWRGSPTREAVAISMLFCFPRPKTVSAKKRPLPTVYPDLDKLVRAIFDALTGVVYVDDAQVCDTSARKRYTAFQAGVQITVGISKGEMA